MYKRKFTAEQLADRYIDRIEIRNLMGRFTNYKLLRLDDEIVDSYWVKETEEPTLGFNHGYYVGLAAIRGYYDAVTANVEVQSQAMKARFPEYLSQFSDIELHGVGSLIIDALSTCVIEQSEDGKTAKGLWYILGCDNEITAVGPHSTWGYGIMAADFVRESDGWKIWHLLDLEEINTPCGQNWVTDREVKYPVLPEFEALAELTLPAPTVAKTVYTAYHPDREYIGAIRVPEPYVTFADTFSYGL